MCGQEEFIGTILARLKRLGGSQSVLDAVYVDLLGRIDEEVIVWVYHTW